MWYAVAMISSLEKKPANGGMPTSASVPTMNVAYVTGMNFRKPPISLMLLVWHAWMTEPAP